MSEEAKSAEPVVNGDDDDPVSDHGSRVVIVAFAVDQCAAVDPDHDRAQGEEVAGARSENIQEEAIFSEGRPAEGRRGLRAVVGELGGVENREPGGVRDRRTPAQIADGRGGVRDAEKLVDARGRDDTADGSVEGESDGILLGASGGRGGEEHDGGENGQDKSGKAATLGPAVHGDSSIAIR